MFDWYSPKLFVTILIVLILSIVDGFLTLFLLEHGAYEVNPIMAYLIDVSPSAFVAVKYSFDLHGCSNCFNTKQCLYSYNQILGPYIAVLFLQAFFMVVVVWELYLISYVI